MKQVALKSNLIDFFHKQRKLYSIFFEICTNSLIIYSHKQGFETINDCFLIINWIINSALTLHCSPGTLRKMFLSHEGTQFCNIS